MRYKNTEVLVNKQCILSAKFAPTEKFISRLESSLTFQGDPFCIQAKFQNLLIRVYHPEEFIPGVPTLVRVIVKKVDGVKYPKIVFVPNSEHYEDGVDMPPDVLIRNLCRIAGTCEDVKKKYIQSVIE
ncbi:MAG: hypothetical protein JRJ79_18050 [Deltaproteobacteria bacterium]|nr:hypothetical protein [Deltaproteobacteria bacterium]